MDSIVWKNANSITDVTYNNDRIVLNSTFDLYIEFPCEGGIRIYGDDEGFFKPQALKTFTVTKNTSDSFTAKTEENGITVNWSKEKWNLMFLDKNGNCVHSMSSEQILYGKTNEGIDYFRFEGILHKDEVIYGLGERFNSVNQIGTQPSNLSNNDCCYQLVENLDNIIKTYINVPIINSTQGYTLFVNSAFDGMSDVGFSDPEKYILTMKEGRLDFYVYTGTPRENLVAYTNLTGKPKNLPKWAFEYWCGGATQYWTPRILEEDDENVPLRVFNREIENYERMGINPSAVFAEHVPSWFESFYNRAKEKNMRVFGWTNARVAFRTLELLSPEFMQKVLPDLAYEDLPHIRNMYTGKYADGSEELGFVDFTHPKAVDVLKKVYEKYLSYGLKGLMVDYGEYMPGGMSFYNGSKGNEMHNFYAYWYTKGYHDLFQGEMGNDHVLFSRAGCAGSQRWAAIFNGDQGSTFEGLNLAYNGGMNVSASGYSNYGTDIGGIVTLHNGITDEQLYMRWMQYATFNPIMRQHGISSRNCWDYGKLAENNFIEMYWLRMNLIDLIYSANLNANKVGIPMVQSMPVAFDNQEFVNNAYDQYLFANELLVCPVLTENTHYRKVNFPQGEKWINIFDGESFDGGIEKKVESPLNRIPVYIRSGAAIPINISKELKLATSMKDGHYKALLVTAPVFSRNNIHYPEDDNCIETNVIKGDNDTFVIERKISDERKVIVLCGTLAENIIIDGVSVELCESAPTNLDNTCFFINEDKNSTIIIATEKWNKIEVSSVYKKEEKTSICVNNASKVVEAEKLIDNNPENVWKIGEREDSFAIFEVINLETPKNITVKWTAFIPEKYSICVSENNEDWISLVDDRTVFGGEEIYNIEKLKVRYIKISNVKNKGNIISELYGIKVF